MQTRYPRETPTTGGDAVTTTHRPDNIDGPTHAREAQLADLDARDDRLSSGVRRIVRVPQEAEFGGQEYLSTDALTEMGHRLIANCLEFSHLHDARIMFLWKLSGGRSKGRLTLGKCQKPGGLLAHFSMQDFIVWLAADNVRYRQLTERQIEALVFHELCHAGWEETDEKTGEGHWTVEGHDVEEFRSVIHRYGLWSDDVKGLDATLRQLRLEEAV
jgi:hypothetical protein